MDVKKLETLYSGLLSDPNFDRLQLELKRPNIFFALKMASYEIRHSNFLAWLLQPNESHGLGEIFITRFLRDILLLNPSGQVSLVEIPSFDFKKVIVRREWKNIDILVQINKVLVIIENKVFSVEHSNQLKKYLSAVDQEYDSSYRKLFVFLTPTGIAASDTENYLSYSYEQAVVIMESILSTYGDSLHDSTRVYIKDYIDSVRIIMLQNSHLNDLARKIYFNHKEVLDFIFENTPNPAQEFRKYFEERVQNSGWVLRSPGKGYVRFLTKSLDEIIPRGGTNWPGKESFLFEIDFLTYKNTGKVKIYCTFGPGLEDARGILNQALEAIEGAKKPSGLQWISHFVMHVKFNVEELLHEDDETINSTIDRFWPDVEKLVSKIEQGLLKYHDELLAVKQRLAQQNKNQLP